MQTVVTQGSDAHAFVQRKNSTARDEDSKYIDIHLINFDEFITELTRFIYI